MDNTVRVGVWNVEWANTTTGRSRRSRLVAEQVEAVHADVWCITEGYTSILPSNGYTITSQPDALYDQRGGGYKVLLWSRTPWRDMDSTGSPRLPEGRFVMGTTATPLGDMRVIGICAPWPNGEYMKVKYGDEVRRTTWDDHQTYYKTLGTLLEALGFERTLVLGDYNQQIPHVKGAWFPVPLSAREAMHGSLRGLRIATKGVISEINEPVIDHLAHSPDLIAHRVTGWSKQLPDNTKLSDHHGVVVELAAIS